MWCPAILAHQPEHKHILTLLGKAFSKGDFFPRGNSSFRAVFLLFPTLPAATGPAIPTQPLFPPCDILAVQQWCCGEPGHEGAPGDTKHRNHGGCAWFLYGMRGNCCTYLKSNVALRFSLNLVPFCSFPSRIFSAKPLSHWNTIWGQWQCIPSQLWCWRNN